MVMTKDKQCDEKSRNTFQLWIDITVSKNSEGHIETGQNKNY